MSEEIEVPNDSEPSEETDEEEEEVEEETPLWPQARHKSLAISIDRSHLILQKL